MKLVYLGTSGAVPTLKRGLSSTVLVLEKEYIMVDCGEGTQLKFLQSGLKWNKPMKILITHLHSDHVMGLFGMLQTMDLMGRTEPVKIFGVKGLKEFTESVNKVVNFDFQFDVQVIELQPEETNCISMMGDGYKIRYCKSLHQVPSYAYLFEEDERTGTFLVDKAKKDGIPEGKLYGVLKSGEDVSVNGRIFFAKNYITAPKAGVKIGFSGDTRPTKDLEKFFANCDYLTFESTFLSDEQELAEKAKHSTALEAATLAVRARVKMLLLNHFSARHPTTEGFYDEASKVHDNVKCTRDLLEIKIR